MHGNTKVHGYAVGLNGERVWFTSSMLRDAALGCARRYRPTWHFIPTVTTYGQLSEEEKDTLT